MSDNDNVHAEETMFVHPCRKGWAISWYLPEEDEAEDEDGEPNWGVGHAISVMLATMPRWDDEPIRPVDLDAYKAIARAVAPLSTSTMVEREQPLDGDDGYQMFHVFVFPTMEVALAALSRAQEADATVRQKYEDAGDEPKPEPEWMRLAREAGWAPDGRS